MHRDFKPSNVLIGKDGIVRVSDFGLARSLSRSESEPRRDLAGGSLPTITRSDAVVGTPAYMAPEQHERGTVDERTDQWAFACSLHEALFGERPFGDDHEGLRDRVLRGEIVEPSESNVPRAIRVALRRALGVKPDDRFASMDELIAELMAPMVRRSRIALAAVVAIALAAIATVIAVMRSTSDDTVCAGLDTPLHSAWNPAKSQQLRERMLAAGQPDAIADRVIVTLEEHSAAWLASRMTACTHAHQGLVSAEQLDRQMRCLDQYLVELGGVVDGLLDPAATKLRSAAGVIDRLRPISDCDDPHEAIPRPVGAAARDAIATAETDLARAQALDDLDQYERALALAQSAADIGKRTGWVPLEGRALALVGECQQRLRRFNESFAAYERAASAAAAAHDDALFADVLVQRFLVLAENIGRPPEALAGRPYIELALVRAGQAPRMRASWLHALAIGLFRQRQLDEALAAEREAVTIWRTLLRPRSTRLIDSLETEANIQIQSKHFAEAEALLREVLPARIAARGPDDESVARAENNWGWLEFERNDFEAARAHYERAARINAAAGTANFRIHMNLGIVKAELGQLHAGLADFEAAREDAIREATDTSPHVVECEVAVAAVLTALGEYDRARPMLDRGLAEAGAGRAPVLTETLYASARFALAHGDSATAAKRFTEYAQVNKDPSDPERAILEAEVTRARSGCRVARSVIERTLAAVKNVPYHSDRIQAAVVAARCDVELGEPVRALAELEPPLSWYEARHADIEVIASALFAKALAVAATGDVTRARALAGRARPGLFGVDRDEVMRWLAQHPARTDD